MSESGRVRWSQGGSRLPKMAGMIRLAFPEKENINLNEAAPFKSIGEWGETGRARTLQGDSGRVKTAKIGWDRKCYFAKEGDRQLEA